MKGTQNKVREQGGNVTMWRSAINEMPDPQYIHLFEPESTEYDEWLEKMADEPWVRALEGLVEVHGLWVGTEEQFFEELRLRAGDGVFASPDFPSTLEQLNEYILCARDVFAKKHLGFWHHAELTEEDLDDFDVPAWGPEAPILVYKHDAAHRPNYWEAMCRLLARGDALPLSVLIFTGEDRHFRGSRSWTGSTTELLAKLRRHSPNGLNGVPLFFANCFRPREEHRSEPSFPFDPPDLLDPVTRDDYLTFHERMDEWAPVLKELKIKVSRQRRSFSRPSPESGRIVQTSRTYWTVERPRWEKRDDLFVGSNLTATDLTVMVAAWVRPTDWS